MKKERSQFPLHVESRVKCVCMCVCVCKILAHRSRRETTRERKPSKREGRERMMEIKRTNSPCSLSYEGSKLTNHICTCVCLYESGKEII